MSSAADVCTLGVAWGCWWGSSSEGPESGSIVDWQLGRICWSFSPSSWNLRKPLILFSSVRFLCAPIVSSVPPCPRARGLSIQAQLIIWNIWIWPFWNKTHFIPFDHPLLCGRAPQCPLPQLPEDVFFQRCWLGDSSRTGTVPKWNLRAERWRAAPVLECGPAQWGRAAISAASSTSALNHPCISWLCGAASSVQAAVGSHYEGPECNHRYSLAKLLRLRSLSLTNHLPILAHHFRWANATLRHENGEEKLLLWFLPVSSFFPQTLFENS